MTHIAKDLHGLTLEEAKSEIMFGDIDIKSLNDFSNQSALHAIRLYHDIGSLHTNSTNVADWQALFERSDETTELFEIKRRP